MNINEAWKELRLACSEEENCAGCIQVKTRQHKEAASVIHRVLEAAGKVDKDDYFWAERGSCAINIIDLLAIIVAALPDDTDAQKETP